MSERPRFSIIVPTHARPGQLAGCLEALARLDYPHDRFEVVVVDDGSEAPPSGLVEAFGERLSVRLLSQTRRGPAAARNAGAWSANGEVLAFTDDDCAPAEDWLQRLDRRFHAMPDRVIGGPMVNALPGNPYSAASQLVVDSLYAHYNADPDTARFFTSSNLALPAAVFGQLGGFDTSFPLPAGEDWEFSERCLLAGRRLTYAPEAVVRHYHRLTLRSLCRQHFNYGRGTCVLHRIRLARGQPRFAFEPRMHIAMIGAALPRSWGLSSFVLTEAVLLTQLAYAAGFARERIAARGYAARSGRASIWA